MTAPIMPGAEPWSAEGGPNGVLVLHGFTGNCGSMRGLATAFHDAGHAVEMPLLPGHGTSVDDMILTSWPDWSGAAEDAYEKLAGRCERVAVAGLSMGGTLTVWLAGRHQETAAAVCVNPLVEAPEGMEDAVRQMMADGEETIAGIGSDIADPDQVESAYPMTPVAPMLSMFDAAKELTGLLPKITCPVLILTSPQDHVVPPENSDVLAAAVSGPVERITLERSYHVATQDYDKDLVERSAVDFVDRAFKV